MREELNEKLETLRFMAPKLNAATDEAARVVQTVEKFLGDIGLGISAWVELSWEENGCKVLGSSSLGYGRINGQFHIYIARGNDKAAWSVWDRATRLESIEKLPELLTALVNATQSAFDRAQNGIASTRRIVESLDI